MTDIYTSLLPLVNHKCKIYFDEISIILDRIFSDVALNTSIVHLLFMSCMYSLLFLPIYMLEDINFIIVYWYCDSFMNISVPYNGKILHNSMSFRHISYQLDSSKLKKM